MPSSTLVRKLLVATSSSWSRGEGGFSGRPPLGPGVASSPLPSSYNQDKRSKVVCQRRKRKKKNFSRDSIFRCSLFCRRESWIGKHSKKWPQLPTRHRNSCVPLPATRSRWSWLRSSYTKRLASWRKMVKRASIACAWLECSSRPMHSTTFPFEEDVMGNRGSATVLMIFLLVVGLPLLGMLARSCF
jgi:hypothetical protein